MARYVCETDHEAQSHNWRVIAGSAFAAVCAQLTAAGPCPSPLRSCSRCAAVAIANADTAEGRRYACRLHLDALVAEADDLPRCEECGDAVACPTEWFCSACDFDIARLEAAL